MSLQLTTHAIASHISQQAKSLYLAVCFGLLLSDCGGGDSIQWEPDEGPRENQQSIRTGFDYRNLTESDKRIAKNHFDSIDLSPRNVELVYIGEYNDAWLVNIYRHSVEDNIHYGAIAYPKADSESPRRIVVLTDGLQQSNPTMNVGKMLGYNINEGSALNEMIFVLPIFRGRTLIFDGQSFSANGNFCDAYDGAATDAIALVNVVHAEFPEANANDYLIMGGSRGGNTALLVSERDARVAMAIATASPVNFYRSEVLALYGSQYQCQFISGKTEEESRIRMLNSSPFHYAVFANGMIRLHQGANDATVPEWNVRDMYRALISAGKNVSMNIYSGQTHGSIWNHTAWHKQTAQNIAEYVDYINTL